MSRRRRVENDNVGKTAYIECQMDTELLNGIPQVNFHGYDGNAVDLSDYGFDAPVVYDIQGIHTQNTIPILYKHKTEIGHTSSVVKTPSSVGAKGSLSVPNAKSKEVAEGAKNGFPYQASMGLDVDMASLKYHSSGKVTVNNKDFDAPLYVVKRSKLREMTVTTFGRDGQTSVTLLSEDDRMRIQNEEKKDPPKVDPKVTPKTDPAPKKSDPEPKKTGGGGTELKPGVDNPEPVLPVKNEITKEFLFTALGRQAKFGATHPELVLNSIEQGWDDERFKNEVERANLIQNMPRVPNIKMGEAAATREQILRARFAKAVNVKNDQIEKNFGKELSGYVENQPQLTLKEMLVECATLQGGHFNGHSDIEQLCKFLKRVNNTQFSTFDMPNLFESTAKMILETKWEIGQPFATRFLKETSNTNFKPTTHVRPSGGEMWEGLTKDNKIKHGHFGAEDFYQTKLHTIAQMLVLTRETIINDDMNVVEELLDLMLEGAWMVPDYKFGKLAIDKAPAEGSFWELEVNDFYGADAVLNRENLSAKYKLARKLMIQKGTKSWVNMINDRWVLVVDPDMEETAFELVNQPVLITGDTAPFQGNRNYWYNRVDVATFDQMGNTTLFQHADPQTWFLMPKSARYAPYAITYLRGQRRPTVEEIELPGEMLGFGVRGYWDVEVNERENEAIIRCRQETFEGEV